MANTFSLILVLVTLVTGVIWIIDKLVWAPKRQKKIEVARSNMADDVDEETLKTIAPQSVWVEQSVSIFPVIGIVLILRSFLYEPFQIPSGSMMPTLLIGDFILVEKFAYGIKDPVWRSQLIETGKPERGDIVVFKYPKEPSIDYIKRVIGEPGDTIVYSGQKQLCIQPKGENQCKRIKLTDKVESEFTSGYSNLIQYTEHLADDEVTHDILIDPTRMDRINMYQPRPGKNVWVVPEGHYFVMGDNRDNSADGRYWGFVPEANLVGKAVGIWMSFEFERGSDSMLPSFIPTGVRFNRIGGID